MALERTFVLLKPDAVARRLTGEILQRFERRGLKIMKKRYLPFLHKTSFCSVSSVSLWFNKEGGKR